MRVLLVSPLREQINMVTLPLGLGFVAQALKAHGHRVAIVDLSGEPDIPDPLGRAIAETDPEVIGISVRNVDDQNMRSTRFFLDQIREVVAACRTLSDAPLVLGGAGYSIFPESCLEYLGVEMGIQGEAETAFPLLLSRLERRASLSGVPGLYVRGRGLQAARGFQRDLDRYAPLPEDSMWISERYGVRDLWIPVQTRRGCGMRCSYCSTAAIEGTASRSRSPASVRDWIASYVRKGLRRFHFVDNTFNVPAPYARELCTLLAEAAMEVSWRAILYPWRMDPDLVRTMARAGCTEAALGFESGSEGILRSMNKRFTRAEVHDLSWRLADCGIYQMGFLLLGGPGETRETIDESLAFADSLPLDTVKVTVGIRIYPETPLARIAAEKGMIRPDDDLLLPRFYLEPGLAEWLFDTVEDYVAQRPNWVL